MENVLAGIPNICIYLDDILVSGKSEQDHLQTLEKVFARLSAAGLTLKLAKCQFGLKSVTYLGHVIDEHGLHPSPEKVQAIKEAPRPSNVTELKSFLGFVNYYHNFMPNLSCILSPLYRLLQKQSNWSWSEEHKSAFSRVKELLQSSSLLVHYNPGKPLRVAADASPYGVGAVLSHVMEDRIEKPIMFASRTLTPAERKYAQVEKEALAIIYAVRKFNQFLHGQSFEIHSDHKPLRYLFSENKQVPLMASARIQRWALILGSYNYTISYKPGPTIPHADALSRLPIPTEVKESTGNILFELHHLTNQLETNIVTAQQIKMWTDRDPVLARVRRFVLHGWTIREPDSTLAPYYHRRNELSILDGCVLWGSRVIIPEQGRQLVLTQLHECHPGTSKMKSLARGYVWWPKMDSDIEQIVRTCNTCQLSRPLPPKAPLHPWEYPSRPWTRLHIDHAGPYLGHLYLIIVDAFSKWIEACIVPSTSAEATIKVLRTLFSTHGIPEHIVSDNGSGFASQDFALFLNENGIRHTRTSPYHPSTNGLAERAVQTIKQGISKLQGPIQVRLDRFLLSYRSTPHTSTGVSPAEFLMGRKLRTRLDLTHPDSTRQVRQRQDKQKGTEPPRKFEIGDKVYVREYTGCKTWKPGTVIEVKGPLSYEVEIDGTTPTQVQRRHVDQLRVRHGSQPSTLPCLGSEIAIDLGPSTFSCDESLSRPHSPIARPTPPNPPLRRSDRVRIPVDRYAPMVPS